VARLAGGTAATSAPLFALTAGNPFFVTEVLAAPKDDVPSTVVDAVLARVHRLDPATREALEQLAVVPSAMRSVVNRAVAQACRIWASAAGGSSARRRRSSS